MKPKIKISFNKNEKVFYVYNPEKNKYIKTDILNIKKLDIIKATYNNKQVVDTKGKTKFLVKDVAFDILGRYIEVYE